MKQQYGEYNQNIAYLENKEKADSKAWTSITRIVALLRYQLLGMMYFSHTDW